MKKLFYIFLFSWIVFLSSCTSNNNSINPTTYEVSFESNMDVSVDSVSTNNMGKVEKPIDPYFEGFSFVGWYYDEELTVPFNFDTKINRDITLYGKWEIKKVKVNLIYGDSVFCQYEYSYGDVITTIAEPKLEGYTFDGLFFDQNYVQKYENTEIVLKEDLNFYIKFDMKQINVSIIVDAEEKESSMHNYATSISDISVPYKEHYDFDGWYYDSSYTNKVAYYQILKSDIKLYGRFVPKQYKVSFFDNNVLSKSIDVAYGTKLYDTFDVTKAGYHLLGLYFDSELSLAVDENYSISNNIDIYTKWEINQYNIELYVDGTLYKSLNMNYNDSLISIDKPNKEHYVFSGWYLDEAMTQLVSSDSVVNSKIKLYGKFNLQKFDIFLYDGKSIINKYSLEYGTKLSVITLPTKEGYTFVNFYLDDELELLANMDEDVTSSKTLYTKWTINSYQVELIIDSETKDIVTKKYMETLVDYANPTKEGYLFSGWFTDESYNVSFSKTQPIKQNITLFAKWTDLNKVPYKVIYKLENISNSNYTIKKTDLLYGKLNEVVSADILSFEGFDVVDANIFGTVSFENMLELEVLYKRKTYDITFYVNDEIYKVKSSQKYGSSFTIPVSWQIDDAILYGWYKEESLQNKITKITNIKNNVSVYALVEPIVLGTSGLEYGLNDDATSYSVVAYHGDEENIIIPNGFNHYPITGIISLSNNDSIITVTLSSHIKTIYQSAFANCFNLETINMNDSVTEIGDFAFSNCYNLLELTINPNTTYIGIGAFYNCYNLEKIDVDLNNQKYQSIDGVLYSIEYKELLLYPSSKKDESFEVSSNTEVISRGAIMNNPYLKKVNVGNSLIKINSENLTKCNSLFEIKLGSQITYLDETVFDQLPSLKEIIVDGNNMMYSSVEGVLYNKNQTMMIKYPNQKYDETFTVAQTVTMIKYHCFEDCQNLTSIVLSSNIKYIEEEAFVNLNNFIVYTYAQSYLDTWHPNAFVGIVEINYCYESISMGDSDE